MALSYKCRGCNAPPRPEPWRERCPSCRGFWNCVRDGGAEDGSRTSLAALARTPVERISTGISEFDLVLGGGIVVGGTVLLSGQAGAGKSTLLISTADQVARGHRTVLYTSGEQSRDDIGGLAARLGALNEAVDVMAEADVYEIVSEAEKRKPSLLILDSVNTAFASDIEADVNSARQIEAVGNYLVSFGKTQKIAIIIVGHQTKDRSVAGPQVLQHIVDAVCFFDPYVRQEGDDEQEAAALRVLSVGKNRHGPSGVTALLEMTSTGLKSTIRKSALLLP